MPEGDSLYRLAAKLAPVLEAREVLACTARRMATDTAASLVGHRIEAVTSRGKNLLIRFDDGRVLHVHLAMQGRMFVERPRSAFWAPERGTPDLRIVVAGASVVGRHLPTLRLFSRARAERAPDLAGLGPDLVRPGWDEAEALRRLRSLEPTREIGEALLLQHVVAGIGNVYKSEVLFLEKTHPETALSRLADTALLAVLRRASQLLQQNLGDGPRTTRPTRGGRRLWVYRRADRPCLRCGTPIVRIMQGAIGPRALAAPAPRRTGHPRSTYLCPTCQPAS